MKQYVVLRSIVAVALAAGLAVGGSATPATAAQGAAPLAYNGEFVEVTKQNTLGNRYHSKDFQKDLAFYLELARKNSKGRKPGRIRILEVLIRQIDIADPQGKIVATCKIPDNFVTEVKEYEKTFGDFIFAASGGAMKIEWLPAQIIDKVKYDNHGALGGNWWFRPKWAEGELEFLKDYKKGDIDFMFFYLHVATRTDNPQALIWPSFGGMAWGNEEIKGARLITLNDHELARSTHEWKHHIFDTTIQETEGITVTRSHGLFDAGYTGSSLGWGGGRVGTLNLGPCMAYYRDCYRYYYTSDMWRRWRLKGAHNKPHEPFAGKAYKWADVKSDFWFSLPRLHAQQLQTLTGLKTVRVADRNAALTFEVGAVDNLASLRLMADVKTDSRLNNAVNFHNESAAFLKTPAGKWLFVKPQLADVYVDALRIRGAAQQPLPVYGYVLEGYKALLAIRLPDSLPPPSSEIGLFRPAPIIVQADGLVAPDDYRFQKSLTFSLKPALEGSTVRYTLDNSEPTEKSPVCDGPVKLSDTATVKARLFGKNIARDLPTWTKTFEYRPFSATPEGLSDDPGTWFEERVTIRLTAHAAGGAIRYTLDGKAPNETSPAYARPVVLEKSTTVTARYFDAAGKPRGYTWSVHCNKKNLTMGKPVTTSSAVNPNERPQNVVDGYVDVGKYWGTIPAPQWLKVDLEKEYTLDRVHIFPYWDGHRYYQYTIEVSTDGKKWTMAVDASKNTQTETQSGRLHKFKPIPARYVKVNMLKNSDNPAVHLVELWVFRAKK